MQLESVLNSRRSTVYQLYTFTGVRWLVELQFNNETFELDMYNRSSEAARSFTKKYSNMVCYAKKYSNMVCYAKKYSNMVCYAKKYSNMVC